MTRGSSSLVSEEQFNAAVDWYLRAGRSAWGHTEQEWRTGCRQMLNELEALARTPHGMVFYKQLVDKTLLVNTEAWHHAVSAFLQVLVKACHSAALPMVTALV